MSAPGAASARTRPRPSLPVLLLCVGSAVALAALVAAPPNATAAMAQSWQPFVLVAGLLLVGVAANADGLFGFAAALLARLPGGELRLYAAAMALVAVVTAVLNLDTAVVFLTPVLVLVARQRQANERRFLYGAVFMANAASLILPGSNLTNLLVLPGEHTNGAAFLTQMLLPWIAVVLTTAIIVAVLTRSVSETTSPEPRQEPPTWPGIVGVLGVGAALVLLILLGGNAALPLLAIGLALVVSDTARGRLDVGTLREQIDVTSLAGIFGIAVGLGTIARLWSFPAHVIATINPWQTAGLSAVSSVLVNNLPAAVLLGSNHPAHPRSLLFGLNIGPNLAVTGSLSALLWWRAARAVDASPSVLRYSAMGLVLVPLSLVAALLAGLASPGSL